jgi:uncharacterized protein YjiK
MKLFSQLIPVFILFAIGCDAVRGKSFLPPIQGYNAANKQVTVLDKDLLEISGISFNADRKIAAINDEDGKLFLIDPATGDFTHTKFGKKRDYEDIVTLGDYYFVLESNGNIHRIPVASPESEDEIEFKRDKKVEFESLYFDPTINKLVLLTKEQREKKKAILSFSFDTATLDFSDDPLYEISLEELERLVKDNNAECKPSAAAIHPITNKLYILASVGKLIMQCSVKGQLEQVYQINPNLFPQPEGLCFDRNGDMYISNEGVNGKATLIKYLYKP